jgi:hypothetical protein
MMDIEVARVIQHCHHRIQALPAQHGWEPLTDLSTIEAYPEKQPLDVRAGESHGECGRERLEDQLCLCSVEPAHLQPRGASSVQLVSAASQRLHVDPGASVRWVYHGFCFCGAERQDADHQPRIDSIH